MDESEWTPMAVAIESANLQIELPSEIEQELWVACVGLMDEYIEWLAMNRFVILPVKKDYSVVTIINPN